MSKLNDTDCYYFEMVSLDNSCLPMCNYVYNFSDFFINTVKNKSCSTEDV